MRAVETPQFPQEFIKPPSSSITFIQPIFSQDQPVEERYHFSGFSATVGGFFIFIYLALTGLHTPWLPLDEFRGCSKANDYGDFVTQVDASVGQVLRALDDSGRARDTLVILTSDNGADWNAQDQARFPHRANAHWKGRKADISEAGHRVPFIARWPARICGT